MDELKRELEAEFFEAPEGEGEFIAFPEEELKVSQEWQSRFLKKEGKMETMVCKERNLALARPAVYLT